MKSKLQLRSLRSATTLIGLVLSLSIALVAAFAPLVAPHDPYRQKVTARLQGPSAEHPFGTDRLGRDILSRTIHAGRVSLLVGIASVALSAAIGTIAGIYATLRRGLAESVLLNSIDIAMSFPTFLLCLLLIVVFGNGVWGIVLAIGLTLAPRFARLSRGPTLALRDSEYVEAAGALGAGLARVAVRHVLPNIAGPIGVVAVLWVATAIRIEASLSFLGLGVQPPTPTWGNMIEEGFRSLTFAPFVSLYPGLAIFLLVLGLNMLSDGLRDVMDPRHQL